MRGLPCAQNKPERTGSGASAKPTALRRRGPASGQSHGVLDTNLDEDVAVEEITTHLNSM